MNFADILLQEKDLVKKIEIVAYYKKKNDIFFDTSVILKAGIAKQFIETMNLDIDMNKVLTACLVYSFKRINTPKEIERIKTEEKKDYEYLLSLGFKEDFCKICREYNRYNEKDGYVRDKEGDVLELVENFGGLILHRPERIAFPVDEAMQVLELKNLKNKRNRYLKDFKKFIEIMEDIEVGRIGSYSKLQKSFNLLKRDDISGAVRALYEHEIRIAEAIGLEIESFDGKKTIKDTGKFMTKVLENNKKEEEE